MFCSKCGSAVADGAVFCSECGNKLQVELQGLTKNNKKTGKKKKCIIIVAILLAIAILVGSFIIFDPLGHLHTGVYGAVGSDYSDSPRHAPNMYVDFYGDGEYDTVSISWRCDINATETYWAVHNWDTGYAGFQDTLDGHRLVLSLWDLEDGSVPTIEYSKDGMHGDFGGEGTGKQVFTQYDWEVGKWYTMKVEITFGKNDKTIFTQYIAEEGGDWEKCAAISYPNKQAFFDGIHIFQEDYGFTNEQRACSLRNAEARDVYSEEWICLTDAEISSSYFPDEDATWENGGSEENVEFNCFWKNQGDYIYIESGGGGFEEKCELPATVTVE